MKKVLIMAWLTISIMSQAQTNFNLEIRHTLNGVNTVMNTVETNSMNNDFKITRLQYYITRISIIHDGNQITPIDDSIAALLNVNDELTSIIPLGALNVSSVEGVKFHIGVFSPVNNDDPSLWPSGHPFAPQNPSMHWGWASGYRFIAFEGVAGTNFSQLWQFHGLGNNNYFEIDPVMTSSIDIAGTETIKISANYVEALKDITVSQGLISHGSTGAAVTALQNFRDHVFSIPSTVSIKENEKEINFTLVNNPSIDGLTSVKYDSDFLGKTLKIYNISGQEVKSIILDGSGTQAISLHQNGMYFIVLKDNNETLKTLKLINN